MKRQADSSEGSSSGKRKPPAFRNVVPSGKTPTSNVSIVTLRKPKGAKPSRPKERLFTPTVHSEASESTPNVSDTEEGQADSREAERSEAGERPSTHAEGTKQKKKSTKNVKKLQEWLQYRDEHLDELLRHDGLIDESRASQCYSCSAALDVHGTFSTPNSTGSPYKCLDCLDGTVIRCLECMKSLHDNLPFHRLQKWTGHHFERCYTADMGLSFQLGHDGRTDCSSPNAPSRLQVFHTTGVFFVSFNFCGCADATRPSRVIQLLRARLFPSSFQRIRTVFTFDVLETFQDLNLQAKTPIYDYYRTLLRQNDPFKLQKQASQLNNFHTAVRIWRHLQALKRAGRGHHHNGVAETPAGGLVVECPACPHPGKNLPDNWEKSAKALLFLYTLFLAVDANFKLKGKEKNLEDIELGPGWSTFVEEITFQEFLSNYIDQPEINTCDSEHDAVVRAAVRRTPGYSVTGAGLVICSRHCLVRPNGACDLQKGERYCNMDYIIFSAMVGLLLLRVVLTYDIACQWSRHYRKRMKELPKHLQLPDSVSLEVAIPSWHINGHGKKCQEEMHVGFLNGVGRLCGDEVEQTWWHTNGIGVSVREMAPAARHEVTNDHWNAFNFLKIVGFGSRFLKNLKDAVAMKVIQTKSFEDLTKSYEGKGVTEEWEAMVVAWDSDKSKPNPYEETKSTTTVQEVRLQLLEEEKQETNKEKEVHETSMLSFVMTGLELEDDQRTLKAEADALAKNRTPTAKEKADHKERQSALLRRITLWRKVQRAYTPAVIPILEEPAFDSNGIEVKNTDLLPPEEIPLYLPSGLSTSIRSGINRIVNTEMRLREAQADDALEEIRRKRRVLTGLTSFKKFNLGGEGNKANTRLRATYERIQGRIAKATARYREAYRRLCEVDPNGSWCSRLHELKDSDIRGPGREEGESHSRHVISWIWTTRAQSSAVDSLIEDPEELGGEAQTYLNESLRVEWCKARARKMRWDEEVLLIQEEMRRVIAYLHWKAGWWEARQGERVAHVSSDTALGLRGYALKQASYCRQLASRFLKRWVPGLESLQLDTTWADQYTSITGDKDGEEILDGDESEEEDEEDEEGLDEEITEFGVNARSALLSELDIDI